MRDLSDEFKLSFRSVGEVVELVGLHVGRLRTRRIRFRDSRPISREIFANAVLLYYDSLPPDVQDRALRYGLGRLGELLSTDEASPPSDRPSAVDVVSSEPADPPATTKKKRRG